MFLEMWMMESSRNYSPVRCSPCNCLRDPFGRQDSLPAFPQSKGCLSSNRRVIAGVHHSLNYLSGWCHPDLNLLRYNNNKRFYKSPQYISSVLLGILLAMCKKSPMGYSEVAHPS